MFDKTILSDELASICGVKPIPPTTIEIDPFILCMPDTIYMLLVAFFEYYELHVFMNLVSAGIPSIAYSVLPQTKANITYPKAGQSCFYPAYYFFHHWYYFESYYYLNPAFG